MLSTAFRRASRLARPCRALSVDVADPTPAPVKAALRELYLAGGEPIPGGRGKRDVFGQPRVVAVATGGGGHLFAWLLCEPGATSCLLSGWRSQPLKV